MNILERIDELNRQIADLPQNVAGNSAAVPLIVEVLKLQRDAYGHLRGVTDAAREILPHLPKDDASMYGKAAHMTTSMNLRFAIRALDSFKGLP